MSQSQFKTGYFFIAGCNSFSTVYYSYYLYFFMHEVHDFDNQANLALAAVNGFLYMVGSFWGGRLAQRYGYSTLLKYGFGISIVALTIGTFITTALGQIIVMAAVILGMCCTWPSLEALVSENETRSGLQHMVGVYNMVWSGTGALAYFTGGAMLEHLGLKSLFWAPAAIQCAQLAFIFFLSKQARASLAHEKEADEGPTRTNTEVGSESDLTGQIPNIEMRSGSRFFLTMARLANPFAYIAINTLIAVIPGVAQRLELSTMTAGFCCSIWFFARVASFWYLWHWDGWHYRFRWLLVAYIGLIGTFVMMLLAHNLPLLLIAQIIFGFSVGLIYYSSLYYSMDSSENMGEHGGIHEAAIGFGNFAGPAIGASTLHFLPQYANGAVLAVGTMLMFGLAGLVAIWWNGRSDGKTTGT